MREALVHEEVEVRASLRELDHGRRREGLDGVKRQSLAWQLIELLREASMLGADLQDGARAGTGRRA